MADKVKVTIKAVAKKPPVKAGSKAPKNIGGFLNFKLVKIRRRRKK